MGGFILAIVTTTGWLFPVYEMGIFVVLQVLWLHPLDYLLAYGKQVNERKERKTRKVVDMGKSMICELAKAALISVLFHTVGIDALSL